MDSFVIKFKHLWNAGHDATLKVETHAGEAFVTLQVGLGRPPPPPYHPVPQHHPRHHIGPARQRRRDRRAAARDQHGAVAEEEAVVAGKAATDQSNKNFAPIVADNSDANAEQAVNEVIGNVSLEAEEAAVLPPPARVHAEQAEPLDITTAEEVVDRENVSGAAAEAVTHFKCDICDKTFNSVRALGTHKGRIHKATGSPIPQLDGESELLENCVTYTLECRSFLHCAD